MDQPHSAKRQKTTSLPPLLDSACTDHVFAEDGPFYDELKIEPHTGAGKVTGIGGKLEISAIGHHPHLGRGLIINGYDGPTLLSMGQLIRQNFKVQLNHTSANNAEFTVIGTHTGCPTYIAKMNPKTKLFPITALSTEDSSKVFIMVDNAHDRVWHLHRILGHPSEGVLANAVKAGLYEALDITVEDVKSAALGDCLSCLQAKTTSRNSTLATTRVERPPPSAGTHLHVDIVFTRVADKLFATLLAVDETTNFLQAEPLGEWQTKRSRGEWATKVKDGLTRFIMFHRACRATRGESPEALVTVHTDPDSTTTSSVVRDHLSSIGAELVQVATDVHERLAERQVRTIRERISAIWYDLHRIYEYALPAVYLNDLLLWVVNALNVTPNVKTAGSTPLHHIKGAIEVASSGATDGSQLQVGFGTVCIIHRPASVSAIQDNSAAPHAHTDVGVVIGKETGSQALKVIIISNNALSLQPVTRNKVLPIKTPLPHAYKNMVNRWCDAAGRALTAPGTLPETVFIETQRPGPDPANRQEELKEMGPTLGPSYIWDPLDLARVPAMQQDTTPHGPSAKSHLEPSPAEGSPHPSLAKGQPESSPPDGQFDRGLAKGQIEPSSTKGHLEPSPAKGQLGPRVTRGHPEPVPSATNVQISSQPLTAEGARAETTEKEPLTTRQSARQKEHIDYAKLDKHGFGAFFVPADEFSQLLFSRDPHIEEMAALVGMTEMNERQLEAIEAELKQLVHQKVLKPVVAANHEPSALLKLIKHSLTTMMLVKDKIKADGTIGPCKGRLVVKGCEDRRQLSDSETFAPTPRLITLFLLLVIMTVLDLDVDVLDVASAFLKAFMVEKGVNVLFAPELAEVLFRIQPELAQGKLPDGSLLAELQRALYGLREAPRLWHKRLIDFLLKQGFQQSKLDPCLLWKKTAAGIHFVLVYVDDILSLGPSAERAKLRKALTSEFEKITSDVNPQRFTVVGLTVDRQRSRRVSLVTQGKYIEELKSKMPEAQVLLGGGHRLDSPSTDNLFQDAFVTDSEKLSAEKGKRFTSVVMTLLYITRSRPDIKVHVAFLSTRMQGPTMRDWRRLVRLVAYIIKTKDEPLVLGGKDLLTVTASADASFAVHNDRKSHTGGVVQVSGSTVISESCKQGLVTKSTAESEVISADTVVSDIELVRGILDELGFVQEEPTPVQQDNQAAILAINRGHPGNLSRATSIKVHWLHEQVQNRQIQLNYTRTDEMIADGLSKPLVGEAFRKFRYAILNHRALES